MHRGYVGSPGYRKGCGKTAAAVREVIKIYNATHKKIYSNIWLDVPHYLITPDILIQLAKAPEQNFKNVIIFLDEIQNIYNSIGKGAANLVFNFIQNQSRKGSTDLIWTSQRAKNVDNRILDDASIWVCIKYHYNGKKCSDDEDTCKKNHYIKIQNIYSGKRYAFEICKSLCDRYNTYEIVPISFFEHNQIRKIIAGKDPANPNITIPITAGRPGQELEKKFINYLNKILGKNTVIRHNNLINDGHISLFDIELEWNKKLYLFDVCGTTTAKNRNPRLNTDLKNFGDKLQVAESRGASPFLAFYIKKEWQCLEIKRDADWLSLVGKITIGNKRNRDVIKIAELF